MNGLVVFGCLAMAATLCMTVYAAFQQVGEGQSVRESIMEAWTNVGIGFGINYVANLLVLPLAGLPVTPAGAFWIGCIFTGISVCRSFLIRRWYNWRTVRKEDPRQQWHPTEKDLADLEHHSREAYEQRIRDGRPVAGSWKQIIPSEEGRT